MSKKAIAIIAVVILVVMSVGALGYAGYLAVSMDEAESKNESNRAVSTESRNVQDSANNTDVSDQAAEILTEYSVVINGVEYQFTAEEGYRVETGENSDFTLTDSEDRSLWVWVVTEELWNELYTGEMDDTDLSRQMIGRLTASQCSGQNYDFIDMEVGGREVTRYEDHTPCAVPSMELDSPPMNYGTYGYGTFFAEEPFIFVLAFSDYIIENSESFPTDVIEQVVGSIEVAE